MKMISKNFNMSNIKIETVKECVLGTCQHIAHVAERLAISDKDMNDAIKDAKVNVCSVCGWWYENHKLEEHESGLICEDCAA